MSFSLCMEPSTDKQKDGWYLNHPRPELRLVQCIWTTAIRTLMACLTPLHMLSIIYWVQERKDKDKNKSVISLSLRQPSKCLIRLWYTYLLESCHHCYLHISSQRYSDYVEYSPYNTSCSTASMWTSLTRATPKLREKSATLDAIWSIPSCHSESPSTVKSFFFLLLILYQLTHTANSNL